MSNTVYLTISFVLLVYVILSNSLKKTRNKIYNEATLATFFGIAIGITQIFSNHQTTDNQFFFELILPIIIMGAA